MNKRILATFLWAMVGWTAGAMVTFFTGFPDGIDIGLAAILAAIVWFDPAHLLWPVQQTRRIRRAEELIVEHRAPSSGLITE